MPVTTPNMGLVQPAVGNTPSPTWAGDLNSDLNKIDSHDHSFGSGVQVTPSGLNINTDLPFGSNSAIQLKSTRYAQQDAVLSSGADIMCAYAVGAAGDLYWNDNNGNKIQITASGGVAGSPGSISNLTSPASATWVSASATFVWAASAGVAANMDAATLILRYPGSYPSISGNYIALKAPTALATGFSVTFPATLPAARSFLTLDASGNLATGVAYTGGLTPANMAVANTALGTDSAITSSSTSPVSLTAATLTTVGRPVRIEFQPTAAGPGNCSILKASAYTELIVTLKRGATTIQTWTLPNDTRLINYWPISSFNCTDIGASSGSNTYTLYFQAGYSGSSFTAAGQMFLMEL